MLPPWPSSDLRTLIEQTGKEALKAVAAIPGLRDALNDFLPSIDRRLSPSEKTDLAIGNIKSLARHLASSSENAVSPTNTYNRAFVMKQEIEQGLRREMTLERRT